MSAVMDFVSALKQETLIDLIISRMAFLPDDSPAEGADLDQCREEQIKICRERLHEIEQLAPVSEPKVNGVPKSSTPPASPPRPVSAPLQPAAQPAAPAAPAAPALEPAPKPAALPATAVKREPTPPKQPSPPPPPKPRPKLRAKPLSPADAAAVQGAAIARILGAPRTLAPRQRLLAVAKLAPAANSPEGQQLLLGFATLLQQDQQAALNLAVAWLYELFLRQCHTLHDPSLQGGRAASDTDESALAASTAAADVYLSALESVFESLISKCAAEDRLPTSKLPPATMLVMEVPVLPERLVVNRLDQMCRISPLWGKVALLTMRELIKSKHALKPVMLRMAIDQLMKMKDPELKSVTMRMLANQVWSMATWIAVGGTRQPVTNFVRHRVCAAEICLCP